VENEVAGLLEIVEDVGDGADVAPIKLVRVWESKSLAKRSS
jgi:hypothetical protein